MPAPKTTQTLPSTGGSTVARGAADQSIAPGASQAVNIVFDQLMTIEEWWGATGVQTLAATLTDGGKSVSLTDIHTGYDLNLRVTLICNTADVGKDVGLFLFGNAVSSYGWSPVLLAAPDLATAEFALPLSDFAFDSPAGYSAQIAANVLAEPAVVRGCDLFIHRR